MQMLRKKYHKQIQDTTSSYEEDIYKGIRKTLMKIKCTSLLYEKSVLTGSLRKNRSKQT